jgi:hypothetical protein
MEFIEKYNNTIIQLLTQISNAHTTTNKTAFIIAECFFVKLMAVYALDHLPIT